MTLGYKTPKNRILIILLLALALTSLTTAPSNWYNPDSTAADINHGMWLTASQSDMCPSLLGHIDYVQSLASTNTEDFYTNTSGRCAIGQIGGNTSRVLYQWYRNNQSLYEYTYMSIPAGIEIYEESLRDSPYGNSTENEVLYLNFDISASPSSAEINYDRRLQFEGEGLTVYDKSGHGDDGFDGVNVNK